MMQDDDDNDDPMILNIRAKNHTSERTFVPWTVIFVVVLLVLFCCSSLLTYLKSAHLMVSTHWTSKQWLLVAKLFGSP